METEQEARFRTRYKIEFEGRHEWYMDDWDKAKSTAEDLKKGCKGAVELFEVLEERKGCTYFHIKETHLRLH